METTYDKKLYENHVDDRITNFLNSLIVNLNMFEQDDTTLNNIIDHKGKSFPYTYADEIINKFGSFMTIGKTLTRAYNGHTYKVVQFPEEKIEINLNLFKYSIYPIIKTLSTVSYECSDNATFCTIDNDFFNANLFESMEGKQLFYLYGFPCINNFNKRVFCYRFVHCNNNFTIEEKRKYLTQIQWFILKYFITNPREFTQEAVFFHNNTNWGHAINDELSDHFETLFTNKYKDLFVQKLQNTEVIARQHNIKFYEECWLCE